jgi:hypothetical protein
MVALELADAYLTRFGGDTLEQVREAREAYLRRLNEL